MHTNARLAELIAAVRATAAAQAVFTPGLAGLVLGESRRVVASPPDFRPLRRPPDLRPLRRPPDALSKLQPHTMAELVRYAIE